MTTTRVTYWKDMGNGKWNLIAPGYAVFGVVQESTQIQWQARVMSKYLESSVSASFNGRASSIDQAKRLVETLLLQTGTLIENQCTLESAIDPYADTLLREIARLEEKWNEATWKLRQIRNLVQDCE